MRISSQFRAFLGLTLASGLLFGGIFALTNGVLYASHSQCSDGRDNDNDHKVDYPQDNDCETLDDDHEGLGLSGNFVTVTDDKESVQPGSAVVYRITLKQQREDARVADVSFHLPHQSSLIGTSDGGVYSPKVVRWTNVSVYKNVTRVLTVNVNIDPDATTGQYLVGRAIVEGAEATDTTLVEHYTPPVSDRYHVSITDNRDTVTPEEVLTYTIRVRNGSSRSEITDVRTSMPYVTTFLSASEGGTQDGFAVVWKNVRFEPGEEKVFSFRTTVDRSAADQFLIQARATAGTVSAVDKTSIRTGLPRNVISTSLSDGRKTAEIGQILNYTITVTNHSDVAGTQVAVDGAFPLYGQIISASDGGISDGTNVRWLITQIAPGESRTFKYSVRVRPDAPIGAVLIASAVADGMNGALSRDSTTVVLNSTETGPSEGAVFFRKSADRGEAIAGGRIRYTLVIRNTLDRVISDAVIVDRYEGQYLSLIEASPRTHLKAERDGHMEWRVPVLQPGESWQASYILEVAAHAPKNLALDNVATLRGSDVSGLSLTERVRTTTADVMADIPQTGTAFDTVLGILLAGMSLVTAGAQRKFTYFT